MRGQQSTPTLGDVQFFVDEDLSGLGLALMRLRKDVALARCSPVDDIVPKDDPDWIPIVADRGWVVITNDRHIRTRPVEADAAQDHGLRCVHLWPPGKRANRWDFMVQLIRHWPRVEQMCNVKGPRWLQLRDTKATELLYQPGKPPRLPSS